MWPWICHGLFLSFSPLMDNFENNVSLLFLAALCHVCLSCKLLRTSALSGAPSGMQVLSVSWGSSHWSLLSTQHGAVLARPSRVCAHTQRVCRLLIPAVQFTVRAWLRSWHIPRDALRCFGWLCDAAVASFPFDTLPLLPFPFCCCSGLS